MVRPGPAGVPQGGYAVFDRNAKFTAVQKAKKTTRYVLCQRNPFETDG